MKKKLIVIIREETDLGDGQCVSKPVATVEMETLTNGKKLIEVLEEADVE